MRPASATWEQMRDLIRPYRTWLALAFGCVLVGAATGLAVPWLSGALVDAALEPDSAALTLDQFALVLLALFAAQAVAGGVRGWSLSRAGQGAVRDLRLRLFGRLVLLPVPFFDRTHSGVITSRLLSDAGAVYGSGAGTGPQAAYSAISVVGGTVLLFWISPVLGLLILLVVPVAAVVALISGRRTRELSRAYQDQMADTNAFAADTVSGIRVIKSFGAESVVLRHYEKLSQRSVELGLERARIRSVWGSATVLLASAAMVAAVWLGGHQIQSGTLSAGELLAFVWYGLVVTRGIADLSGQYGKVQQMLGSADRVVDLLDEITEQAPEPSDADVILASVGGPAAIELRSVTMTYPGRSAPALADVSLHVEAGESVALVGPSGAGKSTVTRLLLRLYEPDSGTVLVAGRDAGSQPIDQLRRTIAVVPQDAHLLTGTVADNLRVGRAGASDSDLVDAARTANALEFVQALPAGFDTVIGERGVTLSGGQQQRLAIARALLVQAPILILDEATSALDTHSEAEVQAALTAAMHGRTSLVIAHRLATIRHCDRVVVLSGGRVVEQGAPEELFAAGGLFAELADLQMIR